jgi:hypothetical protein
MRKGFPLLLRKLDPETPISTPAPPRLIAVRSIHIPQNLYSHTRNPYPHPPGIFIHIVPESVSACLGIRTKGDFFGAEDHRAMVPTLTPGPFLCPPSVISRPARLVG